MGNTVNRMRPARIVRPFNSTFRPSSEFSMSFGHCVKFHLCLNTSNITTPGTPIPFVPTSHHLVSQPRIVPVP